MMNNITYKHAILKVGLPKWPALLVVGEKVDEKLASEIVIRTDIYLPDYQYGTNNKVFALEVMNLFGITDKSDTDHQQYYAKIHNLRGKLKKIDVEYLHNSQIATSYIGGPHGWCDWNGNIFCNNYNVGKWPSVSSVAEDWATIAKAFPTLKLRSQLMSGESCEEDSAPAVEFVVENGEVVVCKPESQLCPLQPLDLYDNMISLLDSRRECGVEISLLKKRLKVIYGEIPQYE